MIDVCIAGEFSGYINVGGKQGDIFFKSSGAFQTGGDGNSLTYHISLAAPAT